MGKIDMRVPFEFAVFLHMVTLKFTGVIFPTDCSETVVLIFVICLILMRHSA